MFWLAAALALLFLIIAVYFAWRYHRERGKWDRILGVLAHELRTPIHGLIGLHFQLGKTLLAPEQKEITQSLFQTSQLLKSTVDKLLHYSKRNQRGLGSTRVWTELDELLKTWKELVRPLIIQEEMELEIRSDFPPGLIVQVAGDTVIQFLLYTAELIIKEKKSRILRLAVGEFQGRLFFRFSFGEKNLPPFSLLNPLKSNLLAGQSLRQSIAQYLLVEILKDLRIKILDVGHFSLPAGIRAALSARDSCQFALWNQDGFWTVEVSLYLKKRGWEMRPKDKISPDTWIFAAVPRGRELHKWFREVDFPPFYKHIILLTKQPQSFELGPRIFCFSLPFVGKDLHSFIQKIDHTPYTSIQPTRPPEQGNILLVDDNQLNRSYFTSLLESRGYSVTEADSGAQAQEALGGNRTFDYLFLDIQMPVMNGFTFLVWLRKTHPDFSGKIIALTADQSFEIQSRIHREDFDFVLAKPLFPGDLDEVFGRSANPQRSETQGFIGQFPYRGGVRWQEGLERCNFNESLYIGLLKKILSGFHPGGCVEGRT
jgi:CheY-like chemotaxis protein